MHEIDFAVKSGASTPVKEYKIEDHPLSMAAEK
jgi:hypothetical protein